MDDRRFVLRHLSSGRVLARASTEVDPKDAGECVALLRRLARQHDYRPSELELDVGPDPWETYRT